MRPESLQVLRNAFMAVGQVVVTGIVMFVSYRLLLDRLGAEAMGIWAVVLATTSTARLSEMGLAGSTTRFVAAAMATGDVRRAGAVAETVIVSTLGVLAVISMAAFWPILGILAVALPAGSLPAARDILPHALLVVTLTAGASVVQAALDGCHRADLRSWIAAGTQVLYLPLALFMAARSGLAGLAVAQVLTSLVLLLAGWVALRRQIRSLSRVPRRWDYGVFRDVLRFGLQLQVVSVASLLFEPAAKLLIARLGSLSAATYFDMAHRMVSQVRTLLVAANQVLMPRLTTLHETDAIAEVNGLYRQTFDLMLLLATPLSVALAVAAPLISHAWLGSLQPDFVYFAVVLSLGYCVNALSSPAYFTSIGTGALVWVVASHVILGLATVALGAGLGMAWGARGVVTGVAIALVLASTTTIVGLQRSRGIRTPLRPHVPLLLSAVAALGAGLVLPGMLAGNGVDVSHRAMASIVALALMLPALWTHRVRGQVWARVRAKSQLGVARA